MDRLRSILAIVDPNAKSHPCVTKAAVLARGFHARVTLLICDSERALSASNFFDAETCDLFRSRLIMPHRGLLETLAEPLRASGLTVDTDVILQAPLHAALLHKIQRLKPDLIVKDTHFHSAIRRALLTHTDWHLIRDSPSPLLLVKAREWPERGVRLAAAVDPGHPDDKPWTLDHEIIGAMEYLSTGLSAECSVVNCFSAMEEVVDQTAGGSPEFAAVGVAGIETARTRQREALRTLVTGHAVSADSVHLVNGAPVDALPRFVQEQHTDVLLMGAIARGNLFNLVVGSSAERVLDRLECDVLVLKPESLSARLWTA